MVSLDLAARIVVEDYLRLNSRNRFLVITDRLSSPFSSKLAEEAAKVTDDVHFFEMESNSNGQMWDSFPRSFRRKYWNPSKKVVSAYIVHPKHYNGRSNRFGLLNVSDPFLKDAPKYGVKHIEIPGLTDIGIRTLCARNHKDVARFNDRLERRLRGTKEVVITTEYGTEIVLKLDPEWIGWMKEDARKIRYGDWQNIPLGEVYSIPVDANGTMVLYGLVMGHEQYGFCTRNPVTLKIENCSVSDISCKRTNQLVRYLEKNILGTSSDRVSEIGLGTNFAGELSEDDSLVSEKFPGAHIGFGEPPCQIEDGWISGLHLDTILLKPTVHTDRRMLMKDGLYRL